MSRTHTVADTPQLVLNDGPFRININLSGSDDPNLVNMVVQQAVISYHQATNPNPVYASPSENDDFGTPYRFLEVPEQYDCSPSGNEFMSSNVQPMTLLAMRMGWGGYGRATVYGEDTRPPFDHVSIHRSTAKTYVFVVRNGEAVTLDDETSMFPSDGLVTRLRMLADKKD